MSSYSLRALAGYRWPILLRASRLPPEHYMWLNRSLSTTPEKAYLYRVNNGLGHGLVLKRKNSKELRVKRNESANVASYFVSGGEEVPLYPSRQTGA
jgi:hypothetical protein